jgi:hypothetical protein
MKESEADIQKQIIDYLKLKRYVVFKHRKGTSGSPLKVATPM